MLECARRLNQINLLSISLVESEPAITFENVHAVTDLRSAL